MGIRNLDGFNTDYRGCDQVMNIINYLVSKMEENIELKFDKEVYIYGLINGFSIILNFLTMLVLGAIFAKANLVISLILSFIPLRSYTGGYHCNSRILCYLLSNIIIVILFQLQVVFVKTIPVVMVVYFICCIYLFATPNTSSKNRCIEEDEIQYYDREKKRILFLISMGVFVMLILHKYAIATTLMSSVMLVVSLLLLEKVKEKYFGSPKQRSLH